MDQHADLLDLLEHVHEAQEVVDVLGAAHHADQLAPARARLVVGPHGRNERARPVVRVGHGDLFALQAKQGVDRIAVLAAQLAPPHLDDRVARHLVDAGEIAVGDQVDLARHEGRGPRQAVRHHCRVAPAAPVLERPLAAREALLFFRRERASGGHGCDSS